MLLWLINLGFAGGGVIEPEPEVTPPGGVGKRRRWRGYPRTVVVFGRRYTVKTPREERELLERLQAEEQARLAQLEPSTTPAKQRQVAQAKVRIVRLEHRIEKLEDRELAWNQYLDEEDEELLLFL